MKKIYFISSMLLLAFLTSCNNEEALPIEEASVQEVLTIAEINQQITKSLDEKGSFDWSDASDHLLWSASIHGDSILTIGYGNVDENFRGEKNQKFSSIKNHIIETISSSNGLKKSTKEIVVYDDEILNYIDAKVVTLKTIKELRQNPKIRYLEPDGFVYSGTLVQKSASSSGCDKSGEKISNLDYGTLPTGARVPWNFYTHKIDQAWAYSKGRGIGVGVVDTGLSPNQANLGAKFDDYYPGRYVRKYGAYVDSWKWWKTKTDGPNDKCGHGTSACATIAAPNNNSSQFVGVAYECNLISYRGTSDVILNGYQEKKGVANAIKALARRSDVKIISMSIGYIWSIGKIKDAIKYAYARDKMIFAAGGTSTSFTNWYGVIFPANMSETVAVTGIEEQNGYDECDTCHKGSEIDFTFVMERGNNHHQPILGYYDGQSKYFGGSSVATASTAGIAALVWAKYPWATRAQVLQRLKESANFYPNKNSDFGYGSIDALKAVRGY